MEPAVTAPLDRGMVLPGLTARDAFGNSPELGEVSNRAGSPLFGCRRSPQQVEFLTTAGEQSPWQ